MPLLPSAWSDPTIPVSNWATSDGSTRLATYSDPTITYSQFGFPYIGKVIAITSKYITDSVAPSPWAQIDTVPSSWSTDNESPSSWSDV